MPFRCFISAPADSRVSPLVKGLAARGWEAYVLSDVAELGASLATAVHDAIVRSDVVVGVFPDGPAALNTAYEIGLAAGLGKRVIVVADPDVRVPFDLQSFLSVRAAPDNVDAIALALDNAVKHGATSDPRSRAVLSTAPAGAYADVLLREFRAGPVSEAELANLIARAIEAGGAVAVTSAGMDRGFDIGVWSDDLDAIGANPLLIELKVAATAQTVRQSLSALHMTPSARVVLVVCAAPDEPPDSYGFGWPILWISVEQLLERLRSASFPEIVRELRNRSVHGPPS